MNEPSLGIKSHGPHHYRKSVKYCSNSFDKVHIMGGLCWRLWGHIHKSSQE